MEDRQSRVCMMGAVRDAFRHAPRTQRYRAYDLINRSVGGDIARWNDSRPGPEPVVERLREIAEAVGPFQEREFCPHGCPRCLACGRVNGCYGDDGCSYRDCRCPEGEPT